jgi:hypothetical protein
MTLNDVFNYHKDKNENGYEAQKVNDNVLYTTFRHVGSRRQQAYYDFLSRTVSFLVAGSTQDRTLTFAEMDPEVLEIHREKLIALGGNPRPLPGKAGGMGKPAHMPLKP